MNVNIGEAVISLRTGIEDRTVVGTCKDNVAELATVLVLIIDDLGMRKLAHTPAENLLEVIMRSHERVSTLLTSNWAGR